MCLKQLSFGKFSEDWNLDKVFTNLLTEMELFLKCNKNSSLICSFALTFIYQTKAKEKIFSFYTEQLHCICK